MLLKLEDTHLRDPNFLDFYISSYHLTLLIKLIKNFKLYNMKLLIQ